MTTGEKIQALRKSKGLSQEQLSEELKVSRQAVSKWESEQSVPEIDKIVALADFFGVSTDYLLRDAEKTAEISEEKEISQNEKTVEEVIKEERNRKIPTALSAVSVMLYILCAVPLLIFKDETGLVLLLIIVAVATGIMIFRAFFNIRNLPDEEKQEAKEDPKLKTVKSTITMFFVAVYFLISFLTGAWHITWIIFIISGIIKKIASAVFELKEVSEE